MSLKHTGTNLHEFRKKPSMRTERLSRHFLNSVNRWAEMTPRRWEDCSTLKFLSLSSHKGASAENARAIECLVDQTMPRLLWQSIEPTTSLLTHFFIKGWISRDKMNLCDLFGFFFWCFYVTKIMTSPFLIQFKKIDLPPKPNSP